MYTITTEEYVTAREIEVGELLECAGGLFVRTKNNVGPLLIAICLCITPPTEAPMNDGRVKRGDISPFELDCPVGKIIMEEFRQPSPDSV